jgi:hypothetical protein
MMAYDVRAIHMFERRKARRVWKKIKVSVTTSFARDYIYSFWVYRYVDWIAYMY